MRPLFNLAHALALYIRAGGWRQPIFWINVVGVVVAAVIIYKALLVVLGLLVLALCAGARPGGRVYYRSRRWHGGDYIGQ